MRPLFSTQGIDVMFYSPCRKAIHVFSIVLVALGVPQVSNADEESAASGAPYDNILVIHLGESFDARRYLETEIVNALAKKGTTAVRSTSMMNSLVPLARETFLPMVEEIDADAVLITQLADLKTKGKVVTMNPQATYNFRPTWYYNVWSVELTEYVAPPAMNYEHKLSLATQLYSVQAEKAVWAMESTSDIKVAFDEGPDYSIFVDEAEGIVKELRRAGMVAK